VSFETTLKRLEGEQGLLSICTSAEDMGIDTGRGRKKNQKKKGEGLMERGGGS